MIVSVISFFFSDCDMRYVKKVTLKLVRFKIITRIGALLFSNAALIVNKYNQFSLIYAYFGSYSFSNTELH